MHTKQNYTNTSITVKTPQPTVFKIAPSFNLNNTGSFLVNITNMPTSLQNVTVTQIKFNTTQTSFAGQVVLIGETRLFNCSFDWISYRGKIATISVNASNYMVSQTVTLPSSLWNVLGHVNPSDKRTFNLTVESNVNSLNATLARVAVVFENKTIFQAQGIGLLVQGGNNVTLSFSWDWTSYATKTVKVTVYTTQDVAFEDTFTFP